MLLGLRVPETMRVAVPAGGGDRLELMDIPVPEPVRDEVLVRIHAAGVNRADLLHLRGRYASASRRPGGPDIAGLEFAGRIAAVPDDADAGLLGTAVMGLNPASFAEYAAVDIRLLLGLSPGADLVQAAGLPMSLLTAHDALVSLGTAQAGDVCVVTAATSAVGLAVVQLARQLGLRVIAISRRHEGRRLLTEIGADETAASPAEVAHAHADAIDLVIDLIGGEAAAPLLNAMAPGGRFLSVGRLGSAEVTIDLNQLAGRRATLIGTTWRTRDIDQVAAAVGRLRVGDAPGRPRFELQPIVAGVVPFDEVNDALNRLSDERPPGKLVITLDAV